MGYTDVTIEALGEWTNEDETAMLRALEGASQNEAMAAVIVGYFNERRLAFEMKNLQTAR